MPLMRHPAVKALLAYRQTAKALTFATRLPQHIHPGTERIHARYRQIGAATGRLACVSPNLQQIPKDSTFRRCFVPEPGNTFVIADLSQIELRVAAEISQDDRMIVAYQQDEDLHTLTASLVTQIPPEHITSQLRQAAKAVNFGLLFGMQAPSLQSYARNTYNVRLTIKQAATFRRRFFNGYKELERWHSQTRKDRPQETRTLSGRRRRWKDRPRLTQLLNTPVQGTAADIIKQALAILPETLKGTSSRIIGTIHDEIILESPEENAPTVAKILKETMEHAGRVYLKSVPVIADVRIGTSWADPS